METRKGTTERNIIKFGIDYMEDIMLLDSELQMIATNLYPPCPQPELAMRIPPF